MSYILDALRKAERERHREDASDIDDLTGAAWDPYQASKPARPSWVLLGFLIAVFLLVLFLAIAFYQNVGGSSARVVQDSAPPAAVKSASDTAAKSGSLYNERKMAPADASEPVRSDTEADYPPNAVPSAPKMAIAGSLYIRDGASSNRLFVGDNAFKVGDKVDAQWTLQSIGIEGVELRSGTHTLYVRYP